MLNFNYYNPARIIFGSDTEQQAGKYAAQYGKRVLLHFGGGSIKKSGLYDTLVRSLTDAGLTVTELGGVKPNPRLSLVREGIRLCHENKIDFILAAGGGSVIDSAKAIAIGSRYDGDVWDFYKGTAEATESMPLGVVLTIPAAGSESSTSSVITNEEEGRKFGCNCAHFIPKFAIMNPKFTCTLPAYQTACGASDILAHLMERYFTQVTHVDLTDRLLEATMKTILYYAPMAIKAPNDYDVRAEIMWAGTIAHNNLLDTGRIGDWGSHQIEHELSALRDVAHGAGLAIVFPAWMKYCYSANPDRFLQFATRVMDVELSFDRKEECILTAIARLEAFSISIGMPTRLPELGFTADDLAPMAQKCTSKGTVGNFKKLDKDDVLSIYRLAM
ncbi:MAG: iron-containing alcohol dehydrogenase [Acetanaerobacterium sp.]